MSKSKSKTTLKKVARKVAMLEQDIETKHIYVSSGTYSAIDYTGTNVLCGNMVQGTDASERTGREIKPTHFKFTCLMRGCQTNVAINNPVPYRLLIVQDRGYNTIVRPITQILDTAAPAIGNSNPYMAGYNYDYVRGRGDKQNPVTILKDKTGWLSPIASGYGNMAKLLRLNVSGKYLSKISYVGGAAADIRSGAIFVYLLTGTSATQADNNQLIWRYDLYYKDG